MSQRDYPAGTDAALFVEQLEDAGYSVRHYQGYAFYQGPGVYVDEPGDLVDVIRLTTMRVSWDTLGMGNIVYPVHGYDGIENPAWVDPDDDEEDDW